ncbi:hypothetical protein [Shewanella sp. UCD-KL12]|uniref:hypothetical protein n=1 Tax=Shewanella sp. UCD-KL12 TaxID=1917163 RepID=UPI000970FA5C|nr:hypothetical protein [Shewanella sp. UCD-KL12]
MEFSGQFFAVLPTDPIGLTPVRVTSVNVDNFTVVQPNNCLINVSLLESHEPCGVWSVNEGNAEFAALPF